MRSPTTQRMSESIAQPNNGAPLAATSQAEEITKLKRDIEVLKEEKESALQRACSRHTEMMHAYRRAERSERALERESAEREGERMRASTLVISYKTTIEILQSMVQSQTVHSDAATQASEAASAQQKESTAQAELSAQMTIQNDVNAHIAQAKYEVEQVYKQRLANITEQITKNLEDKTEKQLSRLQELLQSANKENDSLRKQLQQAKKTAERHKSQATQLSAQREGIQSSPVAAGIHAGFSLPSLRSEAQMKETPRKRTKRDSSGYVATIGLTHDRADGCSNVSHSIPEQQSGGCNSMSNSPAATYGQRMPGLSRQQPVTPTRQSKLPDKHQTTNMHGSPFHTPRLQTQLSNMRIQQAQTQSDFLPFLQQMNAGRSNLGLCHLGPNEAMPYFNNHMARMDIQPPVTQAPSFRDLRPMQQQQAAGNHTFGQEGVQAGFQSLSLPASTATEQQLFASITAPITLPSQRNGIQQIQFLHNQQQQQISHGTIHGGYGQHQPNLMPFLTSSCDTDMSCSLPNDLPRATSASFDMSGRIGDAATSPLFSPQLRTNDSQLFSDVTHGDLNGSQPTDHNHVSDWGFTVMSSGCEFPDIASGNFQLDDIDFSDFLKDTSIDGFTEAAGTSKVSPGFVAPNGVRSDVINQQDGHSAALQQSIQQPSLDNGQSSNNAGFFPMGIDPLPDVDTLAPLPGINSVPSSLAISPHPTTARKHPVSALQARPASAVPGLSTPVQATPILPVCLHCHANWWNGTCDLNEPCQNCVSSGTACERPRCVNFAEGTCVNARCARVHEGDVRFVAVVDRPKALKRAVKKEERRLSPLEMAGQ